MVNNNTKPLFSILVATYNRSDFIEESIHSALNQDYPNIEIVIVDDCSTDDSLTIARVLAKKDKRIRVYKNIKNQGCGFTKNRCGQLAKGDICGYLDPDDLLEPHSVSTMVKAHSSHPSASLIYSRKHYFLQSNPQQLIKTNHQAAVPEYRDYLHGKPYIVDHFATFKKDAFVRVNGLNPTYKRAVDQDLYYRMEEVGKLVFIDEYLYRYRIHNTGISTGKNRDKAFYWHIIAMDAACQRRGIIAENIVAKLIAHEKESSHEELQNNINCLNTQVEKLQYRLTCMEDLNKVEELLNQEKNARVSLENTLINNKYQYLEEQYLQTIQSFSFRLARLITLPIRFIRSHGKA